MKQERIEQLLKGTRYAEPNKCTCSARHEGECACEDANWFTWQEREMAARVQLLAKALVTCRIALERHRGYSLLEAALTEVDAALAEAGIKT